MMRKNFSVIGGDLRQIWAAKYLMKQGHEVSVYGFDNVHLTDLTDGFDLAETLKSTDCVLLPLPVTRDGVYLNTPLWEHSLSLEEVFCAIPEKATVFCGMSEKLPVQYQEGVVDYAEDEAFLLKNAYLTAEAALGIAITKTPISLLGASVLVTGYGRIGAFLAQMLRQLGAKTYVASRRSFHLAEIELEGYTPVSYDVISNILPQMDMIFNTAPTLVFNENFIQNIPLDCFFVDLASMPGGVDEYAAEKRGLKVIRALSLPGKFAPVYSGKIVADTLIRLLSKKFGNEE